MDARNSGILAAAMLIAGLAWAGAPARAGDDAPALGTRTLKEQLSDKASDAQRVNDCNVPLDRRGPVARPDCAAAGGALPAMEPEDAAPGGPAAADAGAQ